MNSIVLVAPEELEGDKGRVWVMVLLFLPTEGPRVLTIGEYRRNYPDAILLQVATDVATIRNFCCLSGRACSPFWNYEEGGEVQPPDSPAEAIAEAIAETQQ
jgi:hypothetical protein